MEKLRQCPNDKLLPTAHRAKLDGQYVMASLPNCKESPSQPSCIRNHPSSPAKRALVVASRSIQGSFKNHPLDIVTCPMHDNPPSICSGRILWPVKPHQMPSNQLAPSNPALTWANHYNLTVPGWLGALL